MELSFRRAIDADLPRLIEIMDAAITHLQLSFLSADQIESSRAVMGLDRQLVADGTYYVAEMGGMIVACGGWSRRATLYGGDHSEGLREPRLLDPESEPARVRAMYTDPAFARRGIGRALLEFCEAAAKVEGFKAVELMGTRSGEPLYAFAGYEVIERILNSTGGASVPLAHMRKEL